MPVRQRRGRARPGLSRRRRARRRQHPSSAATQVGWHAALHWGWEFLRAWRARAGRSQCGGVPSPWGWPLNPASLSYSCKDSVSIFAFRQIQTCLRDPRNPNQQQLLREGVRLIHIRAVHVRGVKSHQYFPSLYSFCRHEPSARWYHVRDASRVQCVATVCSAPGAACASGNLPTFHTHVPAT